jgi:hypothetical protein
MQDPNPSNISGEKVVSHSVEHRVNWSHVLLAVAAVYVAAKFGPPLLDATSGTDDDQMQPVDVEEVDSGLVG